MAVYRTISNIWRREIRAWVAAMGLLAVPAAAHAQATTVFAGGSLTSLRALSPSLVFGNLVIDGQLEIDLSADAGASNVVIHASRFELTSGGSIVGDQSSCSYLRSPNLTIDASGEVLLDGYIDLSGKGGDREITSTSPSLCPETTCNQCYGADAGDLTIRGQSLRIRGSSGYLDLNVNGGWGQTLEFVEYDSYYGLCRTVARTGCSGGDGGRIRLEARSRIDLESAGFELGGGDGGTGSPEGAPGALAELEWSAPLVAVQEIEPNGSVKVDPPFFPGRAQPLGAAPVRVQGFVSYQDDAGDPDAITVTFAPPASNDRLEDLYILFVPESAPVALELDAADAQRDLDLYLIDPFQFSILAESNGPPGRVERIDRVLARGWYLVGASWCCDRQTLPAPPGTAYELRVLAAPEPARAALGGVAAAALATLAARRRREPYDGPGRSAPVTRCPSRRVRRLGVVFAALALTVAEPALAQGPVFGAALALNTNAPTDDGTDLGVVVASDGGGHWVAAWSSTDSLGGTIGPDYDVLVARSSDSGMSWSDPVALNSNAPSDSGADQLSDLVTNGLGTWIAVWSSPDSLGGTIGTDSDILFSRSEDNGVTWSLAAALHSNAASDTGDDFQARLAADVSGHWVAVWRSPDSLGNTIGTDNDILTVRSANEGVSWSAPIPVNTNAATDSGHDYVPAVATDAQGTWVVVWNSVDTLGGTVGTDSDIFIASSFDDGASWTPVAALNSNAPYDSGGDHSPAITTDRAGHWLVAWQSYENVGSVIGTDGDLLFSRFPGVGATWTPPAPLNGNASTDSSIDIGVRLATDGSGVWLAAWTSQDDLGGTIGDDGDVLLARSGDDGATWTPPAALDPSAASDSGDDFGPSLTTDGAGRWVAAWDSNDSRGGTIGTDYDLLVSMPEPSSELLGLIALSVLALVARSGLSTPRGVV